MTHFNEYALFIMVFEGNLRHVSRIDYKGLILMEVVVTKLSTVYVDGLMANSITLQSSLITNSRWKYI